MDSSICLISSDTYCEKFIRVETQTFTRTHIGDSKTNIPELLDIEPETIELDAIAADLKR